MKKIRKRKICKVLGFKYSYFMKHSDGQKVYHIDSNQRETIVNDAYTTFEKELEYMKYGK